MPMPPTLGGGALLQRSPVGTVFSRLAAGEWSRSQITAEAAGSAMIATAVLTDTQGSRTPLAPCEDATAQGGRNRASWPPLRRRPPPARVPPAGAPTLTRM